MMITMMVNDKVNEKVDALTDEAIKQGVQEALFGDYTEFCNAANAVAEDVTLYSGKYIINGKSLMG